MEVAAASAPALARMADAAEVTRRRVDDAIRSIECGSLSARVSETGQEVTLSGYVPSDAARRELAKSLGSLPLVTRVRADSLAVLPRPHCGLLEQLKQLGASASGSSAGEVAKLARNDIPRFVEDELLRVEMTAPDFPAYLYVDYYDSRGGVTHLVPAPGANARQFAARQRYMRGLTGLDVTIAPPFGLDVIVTVASPRPLFSAPRPDWERADLYLGELRTAIQRAVGGDARAVEYDFRFVLTAPKAGNSG